MIIAPQTQLIHIITFSNHYNFISFIVSNTLMI